MKPYIQPKPQRETRSVSDLHKGYGIEAVSIQAVEDRDYIREMRGHFLPFIAVATLMFISVFKVANEPPLPTVLTVIAIISIALATTSSLVSTFRLTHSLKARGFIHMTALQRRSIQIHISEAAMATAWILWMFDSVPLHDYVYLATIATMFVWDIAARISRSKLIRPKNVWEK